MKIGVDKNTYDTVNEVEKLFDKCTEALSTSKEVVKILTLKWTIYRINNKVSSIGGTIDYNYLTNDYSIRSAENRRVEMYTPDGKNRDPLLVNVWKEIDGLFMKFKDIAGIEAEIFDYGYKQGRKMIIEIGNGVRNKVYEYHINITC